MSVPVRLAGFVAVLLAVFGIAWGAGALAGPIGAGAPAGHADGGHADGGHAPAGESDAGHADAGHGAAAKAASGELPGGLLVSQDGYALELASTVLPADPDATVQLKILGPDGEPVTEYVRAHEKDLHLIVVRRDLTGYQHVHPELADDGTWSVPVDLSVPGTYRVLADVVPAGRDDNLVLGADLTVPGDQRPVPLPAPAATAEVDGYTVTLDGELRAGESTTVTFDVRRDGQPVTDLQPYLGAFGHLVALREGDLAYLHVHPEGPDAEGTAAGGPEVAFAATAPSPGRYRLFLDFKHGDQVRTAELTVEVTR